jgi:hypothetical protein
VTVTAVATIFLMQERRCTAWHHALLGALIGLDAQVRFEIGIFVVLSAVALYLSRRSGRRQIAAVLGGFIVALVPWTVFSAAYFGSLLPTTVFAKTGGLHIVNEPS